MYTNEQFFFSLILTLSLIMFTLEFLVDDAIGTTVSPIKDDDGDGIPNEIEENGLDLNNDGTIDYQSDPNHKDIHLELDYMGGFQPIPDGIDKIKNAFANAKVTNPDDRPGINLHVITDEQMNGATTKDFIKLADMQKIRNEFFGTQIERSDPNKDNILDAKSRIFHYGILINKIEEAPQHSGFGFNPRAIPIDLLQVNQLPEGMNFIVSLGAVKDKKPIPQGLQEGTIMHELGHTLGLKHGGDDGIELKPNYFSVMNYLFQDDTIERDLDYSICNIVLDEGALNEWKGIEDICKISRQSVYFTTASCIARQGDELNFGELRHIITNMKINWNNKESYQLGIEHDVNCDKKFKKLNAKNDWEKILYVSPLIPFNQETADFSLIPFNQETADFPREKTSFMEEKTSIQQLKEELSYDDIIEKRQAVNINLINDTLNSLPDSAFKSNILDKSDSMFTMFDSEDPLPVNESSLIKQSIRDILGISSNKNNTDMSYSPDMSDSLFSDEGMDMNVTRDISEDNIDAAITGLESILLVTDSYLNKTEEDDLIVGEENQKQFGNSILSAIESLKRASCTYTKCV